MNYQRLLTMIALVGLGLPANAKAVEVFNWSGCGGQNFASCATVIANYDAATKTLSFTVKNTNATVGWAGRFTRVGFAGLGTPTTFNTTTGWSSDTDDSSLSAGGPTFWSFFRTAPPGITPPNTLAFSVVFSSDPSFANFTFGLREQGMDEFDWDCKGSNRLHVNKTGTVYTETLRREGGSGCYPPDDPPVAVPEPASMVLLATGLIGLAGVQLRRRKNGKV